MSTRKVLVFGIPCRLISFFFHGPYLLMSRFRLKIESSYESLKDIHKSLEKESLELDWTNKTSVLINGSPKQKPLNYYMESALDILYQFDIAVICIKRYYGAAELENPESYEHLKSSFNISLELADFVNDYIINCAYILKFCDKKVK